MIIITNPINIPHPLRGQKAPSETITTGVLPEVAVAPHRRRKSRSSARPPSSWQFKRRALTISCTSGLALNASKGGGGAGSRCRVCLSFGHFASGSFFESEAQHLEERSTLLNSDEQEKWLYICRQFPCSLPPIRFAATIRLVFRQHNAECEESKQTERVALWFTHPTFDGQTA